MALDPSIYDAFMFENLKATVSGAVMENNRNIKSTNLIGEAALANNISNLQAPYNRMDITEAAAVGSVIRTDLSPQIAALGAAVASMREIVRSAPQS